MTNLERFNRIVKLNLKCTDEDMNDDVLVYNRFPKWDSVTHMEMVADLEDKFGIVFETIDIMSFSTYSRGIKILEKLGVDMNE